MEQISRVPQARLVNTYVACLLASCGEIIGEKVEGTLACFLRSDGDQLAELVYGSLPGSKSVSTALSHSWPTTATISRASRRRPSASSWAGAGSQTGVARRSLGLLPLGLTLRGRAAQHACPWARTQAHQAVTVQLLGWVSTTCSARAAATRCCSRPPCSACSTSDLQRSRQRGRPARVCG